MSKKDNYYYEGAKLRLPDGMKCMDVKEIHKSKARPVNSTDFVTTWRMGRNDKLSLPIEGNFTVDWGDGRVERFSAVDGWRADDDYFKREGSDCEHIYTSAGDYTVRTSQTATWPGWVDISELDVSTKLIDVKQWGATKWSSLEAFFSDAENMTMSATDVPDLSRVRFSRYMFCGCSKFNSPVEHWDMSNVFCLSGMFKGCRAFNQPVNNWQIQGFNSLKDMFNGATKFNQPLDKWDTSNVVFMDGVFQGAEEFNQPLDGWDVSKVTTMRHMFSNTGKFNQPLDNWDTSNVKDMCDMFRLTSLFNQSLEGWDVSGVANMDGMFRDSNFNRPLNNWDVSNVNDMDYLFRNAAKFNQPLDNWDVRKVAYINLILDGATAFKHSLLSWSLDSCQNKEAITKYHEQWIALQDKDKVVEALK